MTRRSRRGFSLLESVVALAILGLTGAVAVQSLTEALANVRRVQQRETDVQVAHRFMNAVALWSVADLDRRLGEREQGPWVLAIQHRSGGLYHVRLRDSSATIIETWLLRRPGAER